MTKVEAKAAVAKIFLSIVHGEDKYYLDKRYVRWGLIQKELNDIIDQIDQNHL